jgi:hypothetical protein
MHSSNNILVENPKKVDDFIVKKGNEILARVAAFA